MSESGERGQARLGLPRSRRVQSRRDFLKAQEGGVRVTTPHFVLLLAPSPAGPDGPSRLGITASKQVGNSVERSRCKRLVREAFRLDPGLLPAGVDLVVIVRSGTPTLGLREVQAEWAKVRGLLGKRASALVGKGAIAR